MTLGHRLRELRENKSLTTREMSKILNIGKSTFSNYENDVRRPDYETLSKIADYFNVSTDYLLGRTDNPNTSILKGIEVPHELRELGVEEIGIAKELKKSGLNEKQIKDLIEFTKKISQQKSNH